MTPPSINEVSGYLAGVLRMVRGEESGLNDLDLTTDGFWRSFWAIVYSLPALCIIWMVQRSMVLQSEEAVDLGAGFFARAALAEVVGLAAALVCVALLARPLGITDRFAQWVISANWLSLPVAYVTAAAYLAAASMSGGGPLILVVFVAALTVYWRVYRCALGGDGLLASVVLVISVLVTMFVYFAFGI